MEDQSQEGKGKVTLPYKWRDEEGELDLSDPNDFEKAKRLINQGYGYEKGQQELKAVKGNLEQAQSQLSYWNNLIAEAAETGDNSRVIAALEMANVKVNKQNDDDIVDKSDDMITELKKEIQQLKDAFVYTKYEDMHSQLEAKYSDGKYPAYNRKEVEDFANKKGIRDFEDAYFIMNREELLKIEKETETEKKKKHDEKVKKAASKEPGVADLPPKPVTKYKSYTKTSNDWINDPAIAENLFIDE